MPPLVSESGVVTVLHMGICLQEVAITEGPPILAASLSLDGSLVALQRSSVRLEFVSCKNQNIFVQVQPLLLMMALSALDSPASVVWLWWWCLTESRQQPAGQEGIQWRGCKAVLQ